jgi:phage terminase Nu1 subunit (DNA packaging protein)
MKATVSSATVGKHLGITRQAVEKHMKRGMPMDSLDAAVEWHRRSTSPAARMAGKAQVATPRVANDESFDQARTRKEIALADKAEMEADVQRGRLIEAAAVKSELGRQFGAIREGLLNVAARVTPMLSLTGPQAAVLDAEIRAVLAQYVGEA